MKHGSTLFLRLVVLGMGLLVLAAALLLFPEGLKTDQTGYYMPIIIGMYVTTIPFYIAMLQTLKLLGYVDTNTAFSGKSVKALRIIKFCGAVIGGLYTLALPYFYYAADMDDAPGVMVIGLILAFAPLVVAVFAAVLEKLLRSAIAIKKENDLTV